MNKYYKAKIIEVLPGSVAESHRIEPGDYLLAIDENPVKDLLDYQFAIYDTDQLDLLIEKADGDKELLYIEKDYSEELGLVFESGVFDKIKLCNNKCIFCFVDQQPEGFRESLYVKDDDYRLSYLQGTYITLTNLTKADKKRIEQLRIGPLYVSVHTTNPELRKTILNNKLAGDILEKLKWLDELFIPVHAQIVVCPGYNDSNELQKTLEDLAKIESIMSVAIVPVGITAFRKDSNLKPFNKEIAQETLQIAESINKKLKRNFAYASDEIYVLGQKPFPNEDFYEGFQQFEDGVGLARLTLDEFNKFSLPDTLKNTKHIGIITAALANKILQQAFKTLNNIKNLQLDVIEVNNEFWGNQVTVCGLIVGKDVIETLNSLKEIPPVLFIPSIMLRKFSNDFLDGITTEQIEKQFNIDIKIIQNPYSFDELINYILEKNE